MHQPQVIVKTGIKRQNLDYMLQYILWFLPIILQIEVIRNPNISKYIIGVQFD